MNFYFRVFHIVSLILLIAYSVLSQTVDKNLKIEENKLLVEHGSLIQKGNNEEISSTEVWKPIENNSELPRENMRDLRTEEPINLPQKTEDERIPDVASTPLEVFTKCDGSLACTEEKLVSAIDQVDGVRSIPLFFNFMSLERTGKENEEKDPEKPEGKEELVGRINRYLRNHCLRLHLPSSENDSASKSVDIKIDSLALSGGVSEGRSRGRLTKILLPVILIVELASFAVVPFFMALIALVNVVSLQAGFGGLVLAAFLGLKSLLSNEKDSSKTRVTVVRPHVVPDLYHGDLLHGWSRSSLLDSYRGAISPPIDPYRAFSSSSWDRPTL